MKLSVIEKWNKIFKNISVLVKLTWRLKKSIIAAYAVKIIVDTMKPFVLIIFSKLIMDELMEGRSMKTALFYILLMVSIEFLLNAFSSIMKQVCDDSRNRLTNATAIDYTNDFMTIEYRYNESGEALELAQEFFMYVQPSEFMFHTSDLIVNVLKIISCCYIFIYLDPLMLLAILGIIVIHVILGKLHSKLVYQWEKDSIPYNRKIGYISTIMSDYIFGKEVRINGAEQWLRDKYRDQLDQYSTAFKGHIGDKSKVSFFSMVLSVGQDMILYGYFAIKTMKNLISIGSFSMLISTTSLLITSAINTMGKFRYFEFLSKHIESYMQYKQIIDTGNTKKGTRSIQAIDPGKYIIEFKNVSFRYPNALHNTLHNISIKINHGEKLSIVGFNGAGKTTFIKLLTRLYEPTEGEICINDININEFVYEEYMNLMSVVLQDFKLLAFTIKDNVVLCNEYNESKLRDAIHKSGLSDKIRHLPAGVDTTLFKEFDDLGIEFSGGEGQKLAIARAVYKNSPIVIMDEPTSALDPLAEYEMFCNLNHIINSKTAIYISHRLSSTRFSDHIAVFHEGNIIEYGNHEELMALSGHYAEMYSKQACFYIDEV